MTHAVAEVLQVRQIELQRAQVLVVFAYCPVGQVGTQVVPPKTKRSEAQVRHKTALLQFPHGAVQV